MKEYNSQRAIGPFTVPGLVLALLVLTGFATPAATINFKPPVTCSGDTDVLSIGQGFYAYDYGAAAAVNGVSFSLAATFTTIGGGNITLATFNSYSANTFAGTAAPYTNLTAAYKNLLVGGVYVTNAGFNTVGTVTLNNLNPGHNYALQLWANDSRGTFSNRNEFIYDGSGGATNLLVYNPSRTNGGLGQYIIGNFTADSGSQNILLDSGTTNVLPQMNAVQVRDVSSVWSGTTSGNWADTDTISANFSGLSYSTVQGLGLTNVYFADTDGAGNAVAASAVTVGTGGASGMNAVFQNNALAYTLNSADANGIKGAVNVTLNGTNSVTLNGANTYTGDTTLSAGTLVLGSSGALGGSATIALSGGTLDTTALAALTLGSSQTLRGSGTIRGSVIASSGAALVLGSGIGSAGTLTVTNNLTLNGQSLTFDLSFAPSGGDKLVVGNTLTVNGTCTLSLNYLGGSLYGGTYTLITFPAKAGAGTFVLDTAYPGVTLNVNPTNVTLTVAGTTGGTSGVWTNLAGGAWGTAANWSGGAIATNVDGVADFGSLDITAARSVTIGGVKTIGHLAFADTVQNANWTLSTGTNVLAVSAGSPKISVASGQSATISASLQGAQGFTKLGAGTLNLNAANQLTNGVNVLGGTLNLQTGTALGQNTLSSDNPLTLSNAVLAFATSGVQTYTNDVYLLGTSNAIVQNSAQQDVLAGKIFGSGIWRITTPLGVVVNQSGDLSGFTGTVLVMGNASGNNAGGLIMTPVAGISGSTAALFDYEGNTLNYLCNGGSTDATNYMGALAGNNANVIINAKNGNGTTTGNATLEVGALNSNTAFAGKFRDYANVNTGTAPPQLGIRKVGNGTLTLSGANINTGPTEVRKGQLIVSGSLAAPVTVYSAATFELDGSISSASVTVNNGGTFLVGGSASLGSAAVAVNGLMDVTAAAGNFNLGSASLSGSGVVTGAVTLASGSVNPGSLGGAGTLTITNGDFTVTGGTLTFDLSNDATNGVNDLLVVNGNLDLNSPATISINKLNGNLGGGNYRLVKFSGALAGSLANLTLSGAGPLDVLQQNGNDIDLVVSPSATVTWTGGTAGNFWDIATSTNWLLNGVRAPFTNGEAALFNNTGGTNPVVTIPATVQPVAVFVSSSSNYTFTGAADIGSGASLTKSGTGTLTVLNANTFIGGSYLNGGILKLGDGATQNGSVAGNISDNATLVVANPADQTFSGVISGAGALIKQGAGTLTLNSANSLTGPTTISAGTLALGDGSSANGSLAGGPITNSSLLVLGEISSVTISNNIAGTGGIVNNSPASVILSGVISGTCKLTNDYSGGILHLTATNSYSGGTCINNGAVIVSDPTLHGVGSGDIVINDGSGALQFAGTGSNVFANNIQLPANSPTEQFSFQTITTVRLAGLLTGGYAGQITHFVNAIGSGSPGSILILDNPNNTFTTIPEVYLGTLQFTSDGALGDPANGISLNSAAHINTGFYSAALGGLQFGSNNITLNSSRNLNLVGNENIDAQAFIGTIAGPVTGLGLHKLGSGTLRLTGSGSLTGATVISNGTLRVDCPWSGSSLIAVPGTTLMGTGVISAPITIQSGATLSPGASIGTLTVNTNLTLAAGSATLMELNAGTVTSDRVTGIGTLTYGGTLTVTKLAGTLGLGQSYPLFSATTYTGSFAATNLPALGGSLKWSWTPANGTLSVVSAMASYPTNLTAVVSGGNLNLSWPATHLGWFAQSNVVNVALSNFWFDIPGSQTATNLTVPINPALPQAYYRLRHP